MTKSDKPDMVNHPPHYTRGRIECVDAISSALGEDYVHYCRGQILKYIWRGPERHGLEDYEKAKWYLDELIRYVKTLDENISI